MIRDTIALTTRILDATIIEGLAACTTTSTDLHHAHPITATMAATGVGNEITIATRIGTGMRTSARETGAVLPIDPAVPIGAGSTAL